MTPPSLGSHVFLWALADAEREVRENFPLVKQVANVSARKYMRFVSKLDGKSRSLAITALVKRMNSPVLLRGKTPV